MTLTIYMLDNGKFRLQGHQCGIPVFLDMWGELNYFEYIQFDSAIHAKCYGESWNHVVEDPNRHLLANESDISDLISGILDLSDRLRNQYKDEGMIQKLQEAIMKLAEVRNMIEGK